MLQEITNLKNVGVFKNLQKSNDCADFGEVNIVYGWNYSGKTTLSRVFQALELGPSALGTFDNVSYTFGCNDGTVIDKDNPANPYEVRVFNSAFVSSNLGWDGDDFEPVLLLGEESVEAQKEIEFRELSLDRLRGLFRNKRDKEKQLSTELDRSNRQAAQSIRAQLSMLEPFTAHHLKQLLSSAEIAKNESRIPKEDIQSVLAKALLKPSDQLPIVPSIPSDFPSESDLEAIRIALAEKLKLESTIAKLADNGDLGRWVEIGLNFHQSTDKCEFCTSPIPEGRVEELRAHYSKDLQIHRDLLEQLRRKVELHIPKDVLPSKRDVYQQFREDFEPLLNVAADQKLALKKFLESVLNVIQEKIDNPFNSFLLPPKGDYNQQVGEDCFKRLNLLIDKSNSVTSAFVQQKSEATERMKLHLAAQYYLDENIRSREFSIFLTRNHQAKIEALASEVNSKKELLEAQISSAQKGQVELNRYLDLLLGVSNISIEVVSVEGVDRFTLKRGGGQAYNLSEGEKTAIAFSYFVAKLLEVQDWEKLVVYLDDPISSLDSNHLFQLSALLKELFYYFDLDHQPNPMWKLKVKQLFLSTHNFEFLKLLRDLPIKGSSRCKQFYIEKRADQTSTFSDMPAAMAGFGSEYQYLWSIIHGFHIAVDKSDMNVLMTLPNALRRFVELYTYSRLPGKKSIGERADALFGELKSKRIMKVLHHFSHAHMVIGSGVGTDLMGDIEQVVKELVEFIQMDKVHYEALMESV